MQQRATSTDLPAIPVVAVGPDFPIETLEADLPRAHALIDTATRHVPRGLLRGLDAVSRRWLAKWENAHLPEIDRLAERLARPGVYFLSVNYEWGCSVSVGPAPDGASARLMRALDWVTPGLGRYVIAADVACDRGRFLSLTWPGFTGVPQGVAPGRFAAALNQAPMRRLAGGLYPADWLANRRRVWRSPHIAPLHLLRAVFETAADFAAAKAMLATTPLATPATFSLAGIAADQACVIERSEHDARLCAGPAAAVNHWLELDTAARPRGIDSPGRLAMMRQIAAIEMDPSMPWLRYPVLNKLTRLAMVADANTGQLLAQGFEAAQPATQMLVWRADGSAQHG